jgi:hypothetical protein
MSRSGYCEDYGDDDQLAMGRYRASVSRALNGRRGQAFLREMVAALDAMPAHELAAEVLVKDGAACAIGAVALARGVDVSGLDPEDAEKVGKTFGIAETMVREIVFENDDDFGGGRETPAARWTRMRAWAVANLRSGAGQGEGGGG